MCFLRRNPTGWGVHLTNVLFEEKPWTLKGGLFLGVGRGSLFGRVPIGSYNEASFYVVAVLPMQTSHGGAFS